MFGSVCVSGEFVIFFKVVILNMDIIWLTQNIYSKLDREFYSCKFGLFLRNIFSMWLALKGHLSQKEKYGKTANTGSDGSLKSAPSSRSCQLQSKQAIAQMVTLMNTAISSSQLTSKWMSYLILMRSCLRLCVWLVGT